jgi:hypothetical protein
MLARYSQVISMLFLLAPIVIDVILSVILIVKRKTLNTTKRRVIIAIIVIFTLILIGILYLTWAAGTSHAPSG